MYLGSILKVAMLAFIGQGRYSLEIIVTLFTQNCTFRSVMYVSYVFLSISHSATVDRNQLVQISFNEEYTLYFKSKRINATDNSMK